MSLPPVDTEGCVCRDERATAIEAAAAAYNAPDAVAARAAEQRAQIEAHYWRVIRSWTQDHTVSASDSISVPTTNVSADTITSWTAALETLGYIVVTANGTFTVRMAPLVVPLAEA